MADFCSALYLGMRHPARSLPDWQQLTLGKPAAMQEAPGARALAEELAALQGCDAALLMPSTLHLYWDLFGMLSDAGSGFGSAHSVLLVDAASYPVARWGAQQAVAQGMPLQLFPPGDAVAAERLAKWWRQRGRRPILLADGYCPGAPQAPPLAAYAGIVRQHGGCLVLDDTQVLGVLGDAGGGSLSVHGIRCGQEGSEVIMGASLAKGFGVPLAVLSGSRPMVERMAAVGQVRRHCSPVSVATIAAGQNALRINRQRGEVLRARLMQGVGLLRDGLARRGIVCGGGQFPVQTVRLPTQVGLAQVHAALERDGVQVVAQPRRDGGTLALLVRADHREQELRQAIAALQRQLKRI
ncbi:MAG: hypothetical protein ACEQSK_16090 [Sphingomonadaceae bacterium]